MSKAFVKEADNLDELEEDVPVPPLPQGSKNYMTPGGHARLTEEYLWLLNKERPDVTATVAWAAGNGDRSENGDYLYGKKRLREIDKRLRFLSKRLDVAEIVDPAAPREDPTRIFWRHCLLRRPARPGKNGFHCWYRRNRSSKRLYQLDLSRSTRAHLRA